MNSEKSISSLFAKIFVSVCFWFCVALTVPLTVSIVSALGVPVNLDPNYVFAILKYFDTKLFVGLAVGSGFLLILAMIVKVIAEKVRPGPPRNFFNDAVDEVFSQLVGIGSIITVANIVLYFAGYRPSPSEESVLITQYGWLGLVFWLIAIVLVILTPAKK